MIAWTFWCFQDFESKDLGPRSLGPWFGRTGTPTPPPPPRREGGGGSVPSPLAPLEKALSGLRIAREPSRNRPRDEQGFVGPAPTKARTASPNITSTPSRDVIMREASNPPRERWEEIRKLTRNGSVHCGNCHGLSPLGSRVCGFCRFVFLSARVPTRREPHVAPSGLDRYMNRSLTRGHAEPQRGHTRSDQGQERQYVKRSLKHTHRWDTEPEYRISCSRKGMIRERYQTYVVAPWRVNNPGDIPLGPPVLPDGIPRVADHLSA